MMGVDKNSQTALLLFAINPCYANKVMPVSLPDSKVDSYSANIPCDKVCPCILMQ